MKKISPYLRTLLLAAIAVIWARSAQAQTWDCGKVPGTVTATFKDGTLTISGKGAMGDYGIDNTPWSDVKNSIRRAVFQNGVTYIGSSAFHMYP